MQRRLTYSVRRASGDKENKPPCHPTKMGPEKKGRGRGAEGEKGGAEEEGKRRGGGERDGRGRGGGEKEGRGRGGGEREGRGRGGGEKGRRKGEKEGGEGLQKKKRSPLKNVPSKMVLQNKVKPLHCDHVHCVVFPRSCEESYSSCWLGPEKARVAWYHDQEE